MIHDQFPLNRSLITLGHDCLGAGFEATPPLTYTKVFVVSQEPIWRFHGDYLKTHLTPFPEDTRVRLLPDGERIKNLDMFGDLLMWLAREGADRRSLLVVLGGGVVGDLAGFAASCYMRGMDWFYLPTTLLAQQDASVGGKVAVNLPHGKNLVGQFWEPRAVIMDTRFLATLPARQVHAGYMELLKHGMLDGPDLFTRICAMPVLPGDWREALPLLAEGMKVKARVVAEDPLEKGLRRVLNLGHTFGHALESYTGYRTFLHGEAVGLGLMFAALLSRELGFAADWAPLFDAVKRRLPALDAREWEGEALLNLTRLDKKGEAGVIAWIIPREPGKIEIVKGIERARLDAALDALIALLE